MNNIELKKIFRHMLWADREIWKAVLANDSAGQDEKIRKLLFHFHFTQHAFLKVWNEQQFEFLKDEDFSDINSVKNFAENVSAELTEYLGKIDSVELDKEIDIPWSKYFAHNLGKPAEPVSLRDTILQVTMHTTYHRAQINSRLRELNINPPSVDYIVWLWAGQPEN